MILAVDDELSSLSLVERELKKRYGEDYRVVTKQSAQAALDLLRSWREAGTKVAIVLADKNMPEMKGSDFLGEVRLIEPLAKRVMLVDWGDPEAPQAIYEGCAYNQIEHFTRKPWHSGTDEQFHHEIAELLYQWTRSYRPVFEAVKIVGRALVAPRPRVARPAGTQQRPVRLLPRGLGRRRRAAGRQRTHLVRRSCR